MQRNLYFCAVKRYSGWLLTIPACWNNELCVLCISFLQKRVQAGWSGGEVCHLWQVGWLWVQIQRASQVLDVRPFCSFWSISIFFPPSSCFGDLPAPTLPRSHSCDHVFRLGCKIYGHWLFLSPDLRLRNMVTKLWCHPHSVCVCVRVCSLVQVCVCAFGCCFVGANGLLVDVCQCCCLLNMFVCLRFRDTFLVVKLGE